MKVLKGIIKREEGFTLIEMSLVLFIISVLLLLFVPNLSKRQADATTTGDEAIGNVLQAQVDMYKMDIKEVPASFEALKEKDYLTENQVKKANVGFTLVKGEVIPNAKPETENSD